MSISEKLTQLASIRSNIRTKLTEKGVEATSHNFSDFASDIESIPSGGTAMGIIWEEVDEAGFPIVVDAASLQMNDKIDLLYALCMNGQSTNVSGLQGKYNKMETLKLPDGVRILSETICYNCGKLHNLMVDTSTLEIIGINALANTAIASLDIKSPTFGSISNNGLYGSLISSLIIRRTDGVATVGGIRGINTKPIMNGTGYIYVPRSLVDSYKSATNWSTYADQIRAIEDYPDITGG